MVNAAQGCSATSVPATQAVSTNERMVVPEGGRVLEVEKRGDVEEEEEGEIVPNSPIVEKSDSIEDGEWSKVASGGKNSIKKSGQGLVYGQVRIASPSRFEVLRDNDEEGETAISNSVSTSVDKATESTIVNTYQRMRSGKKGVTLRATLSRTSKTSPKVLSESRQTAKESLPSHVSKKKSKTKP